MTSYTLAGTATSALVGGSLGYLGGALLPEHAGVTGTAAAMSMAVLAITRELGWVAIPLPQVARQTRDIWANTSSGTVAAIRWGLDLGLIFTTWFTFAGIWLLVALVVLSGEPGFGAALFSAYWLGRAVSVWIGPLLMQTARDTPELLNEVHGQFLLFRRIHVIALAWVALLLSSSIAVGTPL